MIRKVLVTQNNCPTEYCYVTGYNTDIFDRKQALQYMKMLQNIIFSSIFLPFMASFCKICPCITPSAQQLCDWRGPGRFNDIDVSPSLVPTDDL